MGVDLVHNYGRPKSEVKNERAFHKEKNEKVTKWGHKWAKVVEKNLKIYVCIHMHILHILCIYTVLSVCRIVDTMYNTCPPPGSGRSTVRCKRAITLTLRLHCSHCPR